MFQPLDIYLVIACCCVLLSLMAYVINALFANKRPIQDTPQPPSNCLRYRDEDSEF